MAIELLDKFIQPFRQIIKDSRSIGIILTACTIISILIANSPYSTPYISFWNTEFQTPAWLHLPHSILHVINDGLMAVFFFLVGLEIKRELLKGQLAEMKKAILPVFGAIGGMFVPALIFLVFNRANEFRQGWGIPMATDIAFSLGISALLGKKVPLNLKVFLTALAIIDDLGAIVIIAVFYGSDMSIVYLLIGFLLALGLFLMNHFKVRFGWWNFVIGLLIWYCIFNSGVHATIAGVMFAFAIPIAHIEKIEHALHAPVNFAIIPIFALANTAIVLPADFVGAVNSSLNWGIIAGLVIGKPLGVVAFCYLLTTMKWATLPEGTTWAQVTGMGTLAGIGFTMSIFIAMLAFGDAVTQDQAKIGVLIGSIISAILGALLLSLFSKTLTKS